MSNKYIYKAFGLKDGVQFERSYPSNEVDGYTFIYHNLRYADRSIDQSASDRWILSAPRTVLVITRDDAPEPTKRIVLSVNVIAEVPKSYETTGKEEINMDKAVVFLDADYPELTSVVECHVIDAFDIS